jgi:hypothetical protein
LHANDQNLIEKNEANAKKAEGQATELAHQAHEATEPAEGEEAAPDPDVHDSKPEPPTASESAKSEIPEPTPDEKPQPPATPATDAPQALSPSNLPLDLENLSLNQINFIGQTMAKSGMFPDVTDGAKALVKILAGKEIGVTPFQAMTNIHIIQGKATMAPTSWQPKSRAPASTTTGYPTCLMTSARSYSGSAIRLRRAVGRILVASATASTTPSGPVL